MFSVFLRVNVYLATSLRTYVFDHTLLFSFTSLLTPHRTLVNTHTINKCVKFGSILFGVSRVDDDIHDVQLINIFVSLTKIKDIVENVDELCFQCACASMFT
jgi:hypothetical protein